MAGEANRRNGDLRQGLEHCYSNHCFLLNSGRPDSLGLGNFLVFFVGIVKRKLIPVLMQEDSKALIRNTAVYASNAPSRSKYTRSSYKSSRRGAVCSVVSQLVAAPLNSKNSITRCGDWSGLLGHRTKERRCVSSGSSPDLKRT